MPPNGKGRLAIGRPRVKPFFTVFLAASREDTRAVDKVGAPISIGFAHTDFGQVRQQASHKPIEIGAPASPSRLCQWPLEDTGSQAALDLAILLSTIPL